MAVKSSLLSLVFTDLVDSTALKMQLGDHKAGELIERHQERVRALRVRPAGARWTPLETASSLPSRPRVRQSPSRCDSSRSTTTSPSFPRCASAYTSVR